MHIVSFLNVIYYHKKVQNNGLVVVVVVEMVVERMKEVEVVENQNYR